MNDNELYNHKILLFLFQIRVFHHKMHKKLQCIFDQNISMRPKSCLDNVKKKINQEYKEYNNYTYFKSVVIFIIIIPYLNK